MKTFHPMRGVMRYLVALASYAAAFSVAFTSILLLMSGCGREQVTPASDKANPPRRNQAPLAPTMSEQAFRDAATQGDIAMVRQAIAQHVKLDGADAEGRTALHLASFDGHTNIVRLLLEQGLAVDRRDAAGRTALMYAASGPNQETVNALLNAGANPDVTDEVERFTALMFAAAEGQLGVVQALLKHGANLTLRDVDGDTARDFAAQNGHHEVLQLLSD